MKMQVTVTTDIEEYLVKVKEVNVDSYIPSTYMRVKLYKLRDKPLFFSKHTLVYKDLHKVDQGVPALVSKVINEYEECTNARERYYSELDDDLLDDDLTELYFSKESKGKTTNDVRKELGYHLL